MAGGIGASKAFCIDTGSAAPSSSPTTTHMPSLTLQPTAVLEKGKKHVVVSSYPHLASAIKEDDVTVDITAMIEIPSVPLVFEMVKGVVLTSSNGGGISGREAVQVMYLVRSEVRLEGLTVKDGFLSGFWDGYADTYGYAGCISLDRSTLVISNTIVTNCKSGAFGGGIVASTMSSLTITDGSKLVNNRAAAICDPYNLATPCTLGMVEFMFEGGAILSDYSNVTISGGSTISHNAADLNVSRQLMFLDHVNCNHTV